MLTANRYDKLQSLSLLWLYSSLSSHHPCLLRSLPLHISLSSHQSLPFWSTRQDSSLVKETLMFSNMKIWLEQLCITTVVQVMNKDLSKDREERTQHLTLGLVCTATKSLPKEFWETTKILVNRNFTSLQQNFWRGYFTLQFQKEFTWHFPEPTHKRDRKGHDSLMLAPTLLTWGTYLFPNATLMPAQ